MYKKKTNRFNRRGKPANFKNSRRSFGNKKKSFGERINTEKFINKAGETQEGDDFTPGHKFSDFLIGDKLKKAIAEKGYVEPTPIQDKSIPEILKGCDVIGIANTGTGKTGAFLVPLIDKVIRNEKEKVLIMAPTRELAIQIDQELRGFICNTGICSTCCVGGVNIVPQIKRLRLKNNFIIGTPGRLKDLIDRGKIDPSKFGSLVLDEADRMLDMGFIDDMRHIISKTPDNRQTLFFSATMSKQIDSLTKEFLKDPIRVSVKSRDTAKNVDQDVIRISQADEKINVLQDLLSKNEFNKVLIFGKTKNGVEKLSKTLAQKGLKSESIHGDKSHPRRQKALKLFKDNKIQSLVATDVAARGLDIDSVSHVINFDIPATYDDYVHRIGRTGRGKNKGKALTFINK